MIFDDTIAAIATAAGVGGVGIIRLSGPRAIEIAQATVDFELTREVRVGWASDVRGQRIDQVLAFAMAAPRSFTGEDVAELQGHGGTHNLSKLLDNVVERGARIAEPGEFTRRAVANGKLDLLRAEALLDVIHAGSDRAWRLAQLGLAGQLGAQVAELEGRAMRVLSEIEGSIDFPDDDLQTREAQWVEAELEAVRAGCARLASGFRHGHAISHGIAVALVGPVNVGKSSLLNALVGSERALVGTEPGTTRDWLEVQTTWSGVAVTLIDTAGWRDDAGTTERRGIELGVQRVATADVVVVVNDGIAPWDDGARYETRGVVVRSKADKSGLLPDRNDVIATSATTGQGLGDLRTRVLAVAGVAESEGSEHAVVTTARQQALAAKARDAFAAAVEVWRAQRPPEVAAVEIRQGTHTLAQLRGVEVGERVLDEVFARFCIGK